ncbi:hypothetical protein XENOCAPTIV_020098 [Xenoophorus captivus]|uniref:Thioredoxin domain-containing protein n=1 Tax=Xenoophorus captivus TaxID=1517983 RepID=A0ABV0R9Q6_9TELE
MFWPWFRVAALLWLCHGSLGGSGRLYSEEDPLVILSSTSLKTTVTNSSSAWLVQFYSSWCGHCIQYSSTWKALAHDVKESSEGERHAVGTRPSGPSVSMSLWGMVEQEPAAVHASHISDTHRRWCNLLLGSEVSREMEASPKP